MPVGGVEIRVEVEDVARLPLRMSHAFAERRVYAESQPVVAPRRNLQNRWAAVDGDRPPVRRPGSVFDAVDGAGCEIAHHRLPVERWRVPETKHGTHNNHFYAVEEAT